MSRLIQQINAIIMYVYLRYYEIRLVYDTKFMLKELHAALADEINNKRLPKYAPRKDS